MNNCGLVEVHALYKLLAVLDRQIDKTKELIWYIQSEGADHWK